jgi:8-oxo-dGTP pyrophosphatase MutT (NUDIX family)
MKLDQVVGTLESKLKKKLPGRGGQILMAPTPIDEARFTDKEPRVARKGAVLLLFYPGENGCALPLIKRPAYPGIHSAQVALPGGKWEESDGSLEVTAIRETEEEIGVDRTKIQLIGNLSNLYIPPSNYLVSPFLGFVNERPEFIPDPREVERVIPCDFKKLMDKGIRKEKSIEIYNKTRIVAPYFDIDEEMVWGATAMMLSELMVLWENYP